jgi:hypothetical protein
MDRTLVGTNQPGSPLERGLIKRRDRLQLLENGMHLRLAAAALGVVTLVSGSAAAQTAQPPHIRQPRPATAPTAPGAGTQPVDLDATRKQFDRNAAKQAEADRKRDAKLSHSMGSICDGCGGTAAAKPARAAKPRARPAPNDGVTSPED